MSLTVNDTRLERALALEMVLIPAGEFWMGEARGRDDEQPVHRVWVDTFRLARYQVTNADYARFLAATDHAPPPCWADPLFSHPQQPVVGVNWFDAVAYCKWLARETGDLYRLSTEAEWERAARGGQEGKLYTWGDAPPERQPGYAARWRDSRPEPVGQGEPSPYGLNNIGDNVHEWCSDWYAADYYACSPDSGSPARNPRGPEGGLRRSSRGGSWRHHIKVSRVAARSSIPPTFRYSDYGFRVACAVLEGDRAKE